jgi:hypothetical protein
VCDGFGCGRAAAPSGLRPAVPVFFYRPGRKKRQRKQVNLPNIQWLIANGGNIEIGHVDPLDFGEVAAVASDEHDMLAALVRRKTESLDALLRRLDKAIDKALNEEKITDEINH